MLSDTCRQKHKQVLTACVFKSVDSVGQEADAAKKTCALLFVDLLVVPYADSNGVCLSNIAVRRKWKKENADKVSLILTLLHQKEEIISTTTKGCLYQHCKRFKLQEQKVQLRGHSQTLAANLRKDCIGAF